jgi:hypothetical protein
MQAYVTPEPEDGVRKALLAALTAVRDPGDRGPWWRTGLEAALDEGSPADAPCHGASQSCDEWLIGLAVRFGPCGGPPLWQGEARGPEMGCPPWCPDRC